MKAMPKDKVTGALGALTGIAGALLLAAIVIPADPLGRAIGAFLGASVVVGLVGTWLRVSVFEEGSIRRGPRPNPLPDALPEGPSAVAALSAIDPTAWTYDHRAPDFAPVISLTEARVARRQVEAEPCEAAEA